MSEVSGYSKLTGMLTVPLKDIEPELLHKGSHKHLASTSKILSLPFFVMNHSASFSRYVPETNGDRDNWTLNPLSSTVN